MRVARQHGTIPWSITSTLRIMPSHQYPHTIENGAGERLTFLRRVAGRTGDRLEVTVVSAPGSGPPMHVHHLQTEAMTVDEGRLAYQYAGEPPRYAGPGESVTFLPGAPHRWWNPDNVPLKCHGYVEPAHNIEFFLGAIFDAQQRGGSSRPVIWDVAFLASRYRSEFAMLEIPALVQRLLFPLIITVGRLLGRYARYADAPAPVNRDGAPAIREDSTVRLSAGLRGQ
jgi:quercetin dioxygenase-like cupin family protein